MIPFIEEGKSPALIAIHKDPILRRIWLPLNNRDWNFFGIFVGDTGSGKSGCAITVSDLLDVTKTGVKRFTIRCDSKGNPSHDTKIGYSIESFLRFATAPPDKMPKGSFYIWDETGVEGDNTQWYSLKSRITKYVMQTSRYLNRGVFLTVPDSESISIGSRRLLQWIFNVQERYNDYCVVEPRKIYREKVGKAREFPYHPKYIEDGALYEIMSYKIKRPPSRLELPYKKIKQKATMDWYKLFDIELTKMKEFASEHKIGNLDDLDAKLDNMNTKGMKVDSLEVKNYVLANLDEFIDRKKNKINSSAIKFKYLDKGINLPNSKLKEITDFLNFELSRKQI